MRMVRPEHFMYLSDPASAKALFKESVRGVEVEIFSYCNRTCEFCGNSFIDRRHNKTLMDPAIYSRIIDDLADISFGGDIWYSRYNEPTADRVFLERLKEARAKLPYVKLRTFTNGDYLTAEYIGEIRDAGLNELKIMTYLKKGVPPTAENYLDKMMRRLKTINIPWEFISSNSVRINVPGIAVTMGFADFLQEGTNRGGSLKSGRIVEQRTSPCTLPLTNIYIDYNGMMVPCCDIRSDYEQHKNCVVYTITPNGSLFDAYANSKLVEWRRSMMRFGVKDFPCNSCSRGIMRPAPDTVRLFEHIAQCADAVMATAP